MPDPLCRDERPASGQCHFAKDHPGPHSWEVERITVYEQPEAHDPGEDLFAHGESEVAALRTRLAEVEQALHVLVALKDGPRDETYRHGKDVAWDRARSVLHPKESSNG